MAGNHMSFSQRTGASVEPAPDVGIVVRFNGQQQPAILTVGKPETIQFGTFPVEIELTEIIRKRVRPAHKPPYIWVIRTESGETMIRTKDEINAARIFGQKSDEEILEISVKLD